MSNKSEVEEFLWNVGGTLGIRLVHVLIDGAGKDGGPEQPITTIDELCRYTQRDILRFRNLGQGSVIALQYALSKIGRSLGEVSQKCCPHCGGKL